MLNHDISRILLLFRPSLRRRPVLARNVQPMLLQLPDHVRALWLVQRIQVYAHQASTAVYTALAKATSRTTTMTIAEATARVAIATRAQPASKLAATDILSAACQTGSLEQYQSLVSVHGGLHSCRLCPYKTKRKSRIRTHLCTHTGERPFKCPLCPEAYTQSNNLTRHMHCHRGERPFSCVHCSASFSQQSSLSGHMSCHAGKKP
nr:zinc finger protein 771-like [Dermacentor andersoni]